MSTTTRERHIVAVFASLVLSPFTLFGPPSAAMAMTGNPTGDITNTPGMVNVCKHASSSGTLEYDNGNEVSVGGEAPGGVPSTLYKVEGTDLINDNASWDVIGRTTGPTKSIEPTLDNQDSPVKVAIDGKKYTLKKIDEKTTTDGTGLVRFIDVYPEPYIVVESKASLPPGSMIVAKAAPLSITPPIKDAKGVWSYAADVYPKNTVSPKPEKSMEVKNAADGVTTWTVKQTPSILDDTNKLTEFRFEDDLSGANDTRGTPASVKVTMSGKDKTDDLNKELVGLDDKRLVTTAKDPSDLPSGGEIITICITKASGDDQFRNGVLSFINGVEVDHALAFTDLGKITVKKLNTTDETLYLSGVEFKVCVDEDGVGETKNCPAVGTITVEGSLGTGSLDKLKIQKCVLFETATPAGYAFSPDMLYRAGLIATTYSTVTLTIENTKTNAPTLPFTGVGGQPLMTIEGVAPVLLAGGAFLVAHKKHFEK